jgi:hypothetical protein
MSAAAVESFDHLWPGASRFGMRNLGGNPGALPGPQPGNLGLTDYFYAPYGVSDHLHQNWWWVRETHRSAVNAVLGADTREYALGEPGARQNNADARTRDFGTAAGVRLGYDAVIPSAGGPIQQVNLGYRLHPQGYVFYGISLPSPPVPLGESVQTDIYWLVDIDAFGTVNDWASIWENSATAKSALFSENAFMTSPLFARATGNSLRARLGDAATLRGLLTNGAVDDLAPGFTRDAIAQPADQAVLFQWKVRRFGAGAGLAGSSSGGPPLFDDEGYEIVIGDWSFTATNAPEPSAGALLLLASIMCGLRHRAARRAIT